MTHETTQDPLERGRNAAAAGSWGDAFAALSRAAVDSDLSADDLELLARAALLVASPTEATAWLERAHAAFLAEHRLPAAARAAFWLCITLAERGGAPAQAAGWLATAARVLDACEEECAEHGYLRIPAGLRMLGEGRLDDALAAFKEAQDFGARFADPDLTTLGRLGAGQALVELGRTEEGTALLDEVMVVVTGRGVSELVAGIVYCAVISTCHAMFDFARASEWTRALSDWSDAHPDVITFRGECQTFRTEILRVQGDWAEAAIAAERARALLATPPVQPSIGALAYQEGELLRLRGEFDRAEDAYREAAEWGRHPEPGLALLRLAQGRIGASMASIRRALEESESPRTRARLLPAFVEIALASGDHAAALPASRELLEIADTIGSPQLTAAAHEAEGRTLLASDEPRSALLRLRRAWEGWQRVGAPYEGARVRALIAAACEALGDPDSAELERDAAHRTFLQLGARPAAEALEMRAGKGGNGDVPFTARELEVLSLVATGRSNREVAADLVISEKTVARHMSNILAKADVRSRTAAVAYARDHDLI